MVESAGRNAGNPERNGVVGEDVKAWELWIRPTLSRELEFPDSKAEGDSCLSTEIDLGDMLGGAYLA
jgi:hypothetical protein